MVRYGVPLVMLVLLACTACVPEECPEGCDCGPAIPGEDVELQIEWEGRSRSYSVHLPQGYDCTARPLLVGLHYYASDGANFEHNVAQVHDHMNETGTIGLFPNALAKGPGPIDGFITSFNDLSSRNDDGPDGPTCTPWAFDYGAFADCPPEEADRACKWGTSCADDVGLVRELIRQVSEQWTVDPDRIYMTGFSQGGISTQTFACPLSDLLAAVAPLHGFAANGYTCGPTEAVSMMQVWGLADFLISGKDEPSLDGLIYDGAAETAAEWAEAQSCDAETRPYPTVSDGKRGWSCVEHASCATGADVVSCQWDGTHTWGRNGIDGDFTWDAVWEFFEAHPRAGSGSRGAK